MLITNLTFGGAQRVFYDHSVLLATKHDITEVVFDLADGYAFPTDNPTVGLDVRGGGGPLAKVANFIRRLRRFGALRLELRPALTISHLEGADYVNVLARGGGKRLLCVHGSKLHDANIHGLIGAIRLRFLIPWLYNRADKIVTVSHEIAEELVALGVRRSLIHPIHNFFDPTAIREQSMVPLSAEEQSIFNGPPVLVASGRLTRQKNLPALIEIFAELLKRRSARLLLIGDGDLRSLLVAQALELGLRVYDGGDGGDGGDGKLTETHDIYFLGFQDNPFRFQRHAQLFVLSSGWEGFPMVLGEAMACGLPIVSADCPTGPREFLAPGSVRLGCIPLDEAESGEFGMLMPIPSEQLPAGLACWVDTLDRLLSDETALRLMAGQSRARAEDFTREKIGAQWLEVISELTGAEPATSA